MPMIGLNSLVTSTSGLTMQVINSTGTSGSPYSITAADSFSVITNEGVTALNYNTLPSASAGLVYYFDVQDSDGMRITANTGDTIRLTNEVTISAGYVQSTTIGDTLMLIAINNTEWIAQFYYGNWAVQTS